MGTFFIAIACSAVAFALGAGAICLINAVRLHNRLAQERLRAMILREIDADRAWHDKQISALGHVPTGTDRGFAAERDLAIILGDREDTRDAAY